MCPEPVEGARASTGAVLSLSKGSARIDETGGTTRRACDQKRPELAQRPEACCLIRLVNSVTWLNTLRRSAISVRIFRSACITVV